MQNTTTKIIIKKPTNALPSIVNVSQVSGYVSKKQLAKELGITERTLDRWHNEGAGPSRIKNGKMILFSRAKVKEWLESLEENPVEKFPLS